ncbi:heavy metal translocating P-type ATPase [Candidatus Methanomassiliicoccus intestinalis]|uniref:heavy metal translocating P-type ATPase n=1 Tax=Candidatus Methanomassiliicoccus intestinalis TaxID=1406512 RepID=UPI0037DDC6D9
MESVPAGKSIILKVKGMQCSSCSRAIETSLNSSNGVYSAAANATTGNVSVTYDPAVITIKEIVSAIEKAGFSVALSAVTYTVKGMTCASCVASIEKSLNAIEGVYSVNVNLGTSKVAVSFDEDRVSPKRIVEAIENAGFEVASEVEKKGSEDRAQLNTLIFAVVFSVPAILLMIGFDYLGLDAHGYEGYILMILTAPVQFIAGYQFYRGTYYSLKNRTLGMDVLIAVGSSAAYFYSAAAVLLPGYFHGHLYFDASAMIITLILFGKYLEHIAKGRASDAVKKLIELRPDTATVIRDGREVTISPSEMVAGDLFVVKPGERIAADGIIEEGVSAVDESMITGESVPIDKKKGSEVIGGTINQNGRLVVKAEKVGNETTLAQIIRLVEDAQSSKAPIQRYADKVASYFVPAVISIAVISFLIWYLWGYGHYVGGDGTFSFSLSILIAVLVISCPCALGLATPTAVIVGSGKGAENGILIKSGAALETAGKIKTVVLDKTGTITEGKLSVTESTVPSELIPYIIAAERGSEHPLSRAVTAYADENTPVIPVESFEAVPGKGVKAQVGGKNVIVGNRSLMDDYNLSYSSVEDNVIKLEEQGQTVVIAAVDDQIAGIIGIADTIKETSKMAVSEMKNMGIDVVMITGDNKRAAAVTAEKVGIERFVAEALPSTKSEQISLLKKEGPVAMIGDGINDAPALALADVGIAIGSGTDVALETGDIVLIKNDLIDAVASIQLSRKTVSKIRQNLFWALCYNTAAIPIAAGILFPVFGILLNPIVAAAAMSVSSITVVANAALLKRYTPEIKRKKNSL